MIITPEFLQSIRPKKSHRSDKYSWNIYRYLKKYINFDIHICWYKEKKSLGTYEGFDKKSSLRGMQIFIILGGLDKGNLCGTRIYDLQHKGNHSELVTFSFCLFDPKSFTDITEWFFLKYQRIGRCIFDRTHSGWWADSEERFTQINRKSRRCNWCGEHQRRSIIKAVTIKRSEQWGWEEEIEIKAQLQSPKEATI